MERRGRQALVATVLCALRAVTGAGRGRRVRLTREGIRNVPEAPSMHRTRAPRGSQTMMPCTRLSGWARPLAGAMVAGAVVALMSGCTVGPDFHRPPEPALTGYGRPSLGATTVSSDVAGGE